MPKLKASSLGLGILALAGLAFVGAVLRDRLAPAPGTAFPPMPGQDPGQDTLGAALLGGVSVTGPSLADMVQVSRTPPAQHPAGGPLPADLAGIPAILSQVRLFPSTEGDRITGWRIITLGMAGHLDGDRALRCGDVLVTVDGRDVRELPELVKAIQGIRQGQVLSVQVERGKALQTCQLTVEDPLDRIETLAAAERARRSKGATR